MRDARAEDEAHCGGDYDFQHVSLRVTFHLDSHDG
jgi:hypothetical protein